MLLLLPALLLQQAIYTGNTSPPNGDTTGYWQQRIRYTIVAQIDESVGGVAAKGTLQYVNNSPDTLHEMFFHQYLNAFRPGSKWSQSDEREHRVRFQNLGGSDFGYERFTSAPVVGGVPTLIDYPGAPDSTVAHFTLPRPLPPGDSITITMAWDARPSTVFRRQGRSGRTFDFAQWYPKVAVYDRGGWEPNPLVPAGELYGEFGTYDVTIIARDDQVLGGTGVVVQGDPGWARVSRTGAPWMPTHAYADVPASEPLVIPAGQRAVRFYAENVHHFAWTASPNYIYEGGIYVRPQTAKRRFSTFDTVAVNVLFKPGDDTTWGKGIAVRRTLDALTWLEALYGPYAYPQISNVHRLDGGGTEFPMMVMNGSASFGLIDHEFGHVFTYGILANNEWRSAWMDEGLTEYQSEWAQQLTAQDNPARPPGDLKPIPPGYRANATTISHADSASFDQLRLELMGRAEPIGRSAPDFNEFGVYNSMVYTRAALMYGHLRDMMGDAQFRAFLHDYYDRWAFRHVDERAMQASAEHVYGASLGWFFNQWLRGTGLLNYGLGEDTTVAMGDKFVTRVRISRYGELRHAMPVGVHSSAGWTIGRAKPELDDQWVDVTTPAKPDSIALDPYHTTWDWDWRDNTQQRWVGTINAPDVVVDWPFLAQSNRARTIVAIAPRIWYSNPQGLILGVGARTNYLGMTDIHSSGLAFATRDAHGAGGSSSFPTRLQFRAVADDVYLSPFMSRPLMGVRGGLYLLDGIARADLTKRWDLSPFTFANGPKIDVAAGVTVTRPLEVSLLPEQWSNANVSELSVAGHYRTAPQRDSQLTTIALDAGVGYSESRDGSARSRPYARVLASLENTTWLAVNRTLTIRINGGLAPDAPLQRSVFASSKDPWETFGDDYFRPRGALFKQPDITLVPAGGARLRGFSPYLAFDRVVSGNIDLQQRLTTWAGQFGTLAFWAGPFVDAGAAAIAGASPGGLLDPFMVDAGVGLSIRGKFYDRAVAMRIDAPLAVNHPVTPASLGGLPSSGIRWSVSW